MGTKISALPAATALTGTELIVCVQSSTTKQSTPLAALLVSSSDNNTQVGAGAGAAITSGQGNTMIGRSTNVQPGTISNSIAIGFNATVLASNQCVIGLTGTYRVSVGFGGNVAPADADSINSFAFLYWTFTNGNVQLNFKGKASNATVVTRENILSGADSRLSLWLGTTPNATEIGDQVSDTVHDATNATPIVVQSVGHTLFTGAQVSISGATGNTAANGNWTVTVVDDDHFSLNGSIGNGVYDADSAGWTQTDLGNIAIGPALGAIGSLASNTDGYGNIAIGSPSMDGNPQPFPPLSSNTTGVNNIAIGGSALALNTTGTGSIAIGESTLYSNVTGTNIAIGAYTLYSCTGSGNTAFGDSSGGSMVAGNNNTLIGGGSGSAITSGSGIVCVGSSANVDDGTLDGMIAIGYNAIVRGEYQCVIGAESPNGVAIGFGGDEAPADAEIVAGQAFLYWDFTNGAPALKVKGKTLDGTVFNKTITWS